MSFAYLKYITTVRELAGEIKKATNDYKARKIDNQEISKVVSYYAEHFPEKLFDGEDLNTTIKQIIGIKRTSLVVMLLNENQQRGGK